MTRAPISRRSLLGAAATLALCPPIGAKALSNIGLALYTLRDVVLEHPLEALREAASIGYREAEIMRRQIAPLAPHLKTAGIRPVSVHFETPLITGNFDAWNDAKMPPIDDRYTFDRAVAESKAAGIEYMVFNYLPPKERGGLDYYRSLAAKLNDAAVKCRGAGMTLCYHNHNFEFEPKPGGRPIDILLDRLDPRLIRLEVDPFWVGMAGLDPADFVRRNGARIEMIHLKDRAPGLSPRFDIASVPNDTFKEVGSGDLNFKQILRAASDAGVKHYFVEQDHSADPLRSIRQSYRYLCNLDF